MQGDCGQGSLNKSYEMNTFNVFKILYNFDLSTVISAYRKLE